MPSDRSFQLLEVVPGRMENSPAVSRRNWPDETKARIVEEALAPDVNVSAVARRYGMSPSQLFGWRRKAIAKCEVERREEPVGEAGPAGGVIEIGIAGTTVRVDPMVSEDHLRRVIRAKRADRIKIVWWDGTGLCLYAKRLEKTAFCWPRIGHNRVQLGHAQLLALVDGMDWKRVRAVPVSRPQSAG